MDGSQPSTGCVIVTQKGLTLFCFPCAGASAAGYQRWRRQLPEWVTIKPVELPGRGALGQERLYTDYSLLVHRLTEDIIHDVPYDYAFFGHSFGGLLAYGCAHHLRDLNRPLPLSLIIACSPAPSRRDDSRFRTLTNDEDLIKELKKMSGTPTELFEHPDLLRMTLDVLAADFSTCASFEYQKRNPLDIETWVFGGKQDDIVEDALAAWSQETSAPMTLEMYEGGHFFLKDQEKSFLTRLEDKLRGLVPGIHGSSIGWLAPHPYCKQGP